MQVVENPATGHSFIDIQDSAYANTFIGHYKHTLNDSIVTWIVKARCNLLVTGSLALKTHIPKERIPCCPYCGTKGNDTIAHRLNGCKANLAQQTKRHNNIQNVLLQYMKNRLGTNMRYRTNSTINIGDTRIDKKYATLKPDIIAWDEKDLIIVEFSCVYANVGKDGNKLKYVYDQKISKYAGLVKECKEKTGRKVKLYTIIVSSLGAVFKKSIDGIKELLRISKKDNKLLNTVLRRMSISACIGSYFIYNKLPFKEYKNEYEQEENDKTSEATVSEDDSTQNEGSEEEETNEVKVSEDDNTQI